MVTRHREIAGMMQAPVAGPPVGDDWTNLWYFTETDGAGGAQLDYLDHRGTAPISMDADSVVVVIDGAYAVRKQRYVGIETQVSDLAADGLDMLDTSQPYTWVSGVALSASFPALLRSDIVTAAPAATSPGTSEGDDIRFYTVAASYVKAAANPGGNLRMILAITRDGTGNEYGYVVSGYNSASAVGAVATPDTARPVLGWDRRPGQDSRGGVYWSGIQHKFTQLSDIQALWAAWDAATVGGDALWKPGL